MSLAAAAFWGNREAHDSLVHWVLTFHLYPLVTSLHSPAFFFLLLLYVGLVTRDREHGVERLRACFRKPAPVSRRN